MPLHPTARRRLALTRAQVPSFIQAWREIFHVNEDEQYDALVASLRAADDRRSELFDAIEAALPGTAQALLRALEAAWSLEADAREEAAYVVGAVIGQTRPTCSDCQADRLRASMVASTWRRFSRLAARVNK